MNKDFKDSLIASASNSVMLCDDFRGMIDKIDFAAMHEIHSFGEPGYSVDAGVATIKVRGLLVDETGNDLIDWGITGYDVIAKYIENANEDTAVSRIVLDIDSGGGFVPGLQGVVDAIAASERRIDTYASGMMASAAYWLGCCGEEVRASESADIGSIGVYVIHHDYSKQLEDEGIIARIFRSGRHKGEFESDLPLTEEAQERLQNHVDETAQGFFAHVSAKRGVSVSGIEALEGDAFNSERALELNLIDAIGAFPMSTDTTNTPASSDTAAQAGEGITGFSQEQLDKAVADAIAAQAAEFEAKAVAKAERDTAINAVENVSDEAKAVYLTGVGASVATEVAVAALKATPAQSFVAASEEDGGAGVESAPTELAEDKKDDLEARNEKALAGQKDIGSVL